LDEKGNYLSKFLTISKKRVIVKTTIKSDMLGAVASGLCVIHCIATPFLFVVQSCSINKCCDSSPAWWSSIDYLFIGITFFAVFYSSRNTSKRWMKYALYGAWMALSFFMLNEKIGLLHLSAWWKYISAIAMISVHLYNLKYCQCSEGACCIASPI